MKKILLLTIVILSTLVGTAQLPNSFPTNVYNKYNYFRHYVRVDSGIIIPDRNITWTPIGPAIQYHAGNIYYYSTLTSSWRKMLSSVDTVNMWNVYGNAGTTAGSNFLGTTDAVAMVFKTNNTERMRILSGGSIGIGTSTPDSMLTIENGILVKRGVRFSGLPIGIPTGAKRLLVDAAGKMYVSDTTAGGGGGGSTDTSNLSRRIDKKQDLPFNHSTITEAGMYTAFAFSYTYQDTLHIVASQGVDHIDKMNLVDFVTGDGGRTYTKRTILTHADTSYRDAGGGVDSAGRVWLFASKYTFTSANNYSTDPIINVYKYNSANATYEPFQSNLTRNGNAFAVSYGKVVSIGDTTLMTAYGGNVSKVWIYASVNNGAWSVKSNIYTGGDDNNESCLERISNNTLVCISRTSGLSPKFFISHDCGNTWTNTGNVYNGAANHVSPWLQKTNDSTLTYLFGDRSSAAYFLKGAEFRISYLDTAIASTASENSFYHNLNIAESILNNRTNTANMGGHFGYPSITYANGGYVVIYNDLYSLQPTPYGGSDPVTTSLITIPLKGKVFLKAYNPAAQAFPTDVETRHTFTATYHDNYGMLQANNNIIIRKDGLYDIRFSSSFTTSTAGRRILKIYKVDGTDTATTTNRKIVIQKDFNTIAGYAGYDHNIYSSARYFFNKGDIIKVIIAVYGASGNVVNAYTQLPGGSNEGIYANYIEAEEINGATNISGSGQFIEGGPVSPSIRSITASTTASLGDYTILADATGGAVTVTLPPAASATRKIFNIKKTDASGNAITIDGNGSETIDGATTQTISVQNITIQIQSNGTNWFILN